MMTKAERRAYIEAQNYPVLNLAQFKAPIPCAPCKGTGDNPRDPRDVCDYCQGSGVREPR